MASPQEIAALMMQQPEAQTPPMGALLAGARAQLATQPMRLAPQDTVQADANAAAMMPETYANPAVRGAMGQLATLPRRAIEASAQDVQHLGEEGYQRQAIAPAVETAMTMMGGAGVVPAEANALRTGVSFPLYHGSPKAGLTEILPSERGALGPGAYFTPADNVAARYGDNVYQLPEKQRDIFNGLGDRYGSYEDWKADQARLMDAVEPEKKAELQGILDKMWTGDGYPMHGRIASMYGDEAKAQDLYRRAGFEGVAGHADGPEVNLFDPQSLQAAHADGYQVTNLMQGQQSPMFKTLDEAKQWKDAQGSRNYVVFNDKLIDIARKYGMGSLAALPPATLAALQRDTNQ